MGENVIEDLLDDIEYEWGAETIDPWITEASWDITRAQNAVAHPSVGDPVIQGCLLHEAAMDVEYMDESMDDVQLEIERIADAPAAPYVMDEPLVFTAGTITISVQLLEQATDAYKTLEQALRDAIEKVEAAPLW